MREREDENRRLRKMYVEKKLKAEVVSEASRQKVVKSSRRRPMA